MGILGWLADHIRVLTTEFTGSEILRKCLSVNEPRPTPSIPALPAAQVPAGGYVGALPQGHIAYSVLPACGTLEPHTLFIYSQAHRQFF